MNRVYLSHRDHQIIYIIENHREVRKAYVVRREGGFTVIELMDGSLIRLRNSRLFASKESADKELDRWRSRNLRMMDPETIWSAGSRSLSLCERLGPYAYPH